jgi:hypothetical protein
LDSLREALQKKLLSASEEAEELRHSKSEVGDSAGLGKTLQFSIGWWFQTSFVFHNIWDNPSH